MHWFRLFSVCLRCSDFQVSAFLQTLSICLHSSDFLVSAVCQWNCRTSDPRLSRDAVHVLHMASLSKTHDPSPHESLKGEVRYAQVTLARRFDREDIWMAPLSDNS